MEGADDVLAYELAASSTRLQGAERDAAAFKIENGALKEQVDVASREVAALEERLASSRRERDATVDGLEHKVRAYETLELELDSAVLRCADGTQGVDANGNVLASPELRDAALAAGLSRPERRVRHAVLLAQKLLRTEAELRESLQGEDGARAAAAAAAADADPNDAYAATATFNKATGRFEFADGLNYWDAVGRPQDRDGRMMSHYFDINTLEANRAEAEVKKKKLKKYDWRKYAAMKKDEKRKRKVQQLLMD